MAEGIGAQRVDFIAVPTKDRDRAEKFYVLHCRYAPYPHGTQP